LGEVTTRVMKEEFPKIVNLKFTAQVEDELGDIQYGEADWVETLDKFYADFSKTLDKAKEKNKDVKITLKEDETDLVCENCGRPMMVKYGRFGRFIACSGYPVPILCRHKDEHTTFNNYCYDRKTKPERNAQVIAAIQ
jgi:DNA topoisomerase-1